MERVRKAELPTIVTNDTFRLAPWADILYAADAKWWTVNAQEALKFAGIKVTANDGCAFKAVMLLKRTGDEGFDPDPACIRTGGNSAYQAIHVALHAGAARILLLGADMGGQHWFGRHKFPLNDPTPDSFEAWIPRFAALNGRGAEIVNCSMGSRLTCFPKAPIEDALA